MESSKQWFSDCVIQIKLKWKSIYIPVINTKMNTDDIKMCDCCMKEWNNDINPQDMCHCCCSRCYGLLRDCQYNCSEENVEEDESEYDVDDVEDDSETDGEDEEDCEENDQ